MKKILLLLCYALVVLPVALAEAPPVKVGVILDLTGPAAQFGKWAKNGLDLALEQMSPEDSSRINLIVEDDGLEASRAVSAVRKLVDIDKVDVVISWSSGTAKAIVGITEAKKIPMLAIASDPSVAVGKKFAFTYWALPNVEARILHDHLVQQGKKRVAMVSLTHPGTLAIREAFVKIAKEDGQITVVFDQEIPGEVTDFRSTLGRLKIVGAVDAFIPIFFPGQLSLIIKQARQVGVNAPLYGFETFDDKSEIAAAEGHMLGGIFSTGADPTEKFIRDYKARFPEDSFYTANNSYDVLTLVAAATRQSKNSENVAKFFEELHDYQTSSGLVTATKDHRFNLPCVLKIVTANGVVNYPPP